MAKDKTNTSVAQIKKPKKKRPGGTKQNVSSVVSGQVTADDFK